MSLEELSLGGVDFCDWFFETTFWGLDGDKAGEKESFKLGCSFEEGGGFEERLIFRCCSNRR